MIPVNGCEMLAALCEQIVLVEPEIEPGRFLEVLGPNGGRDRNRVSGGFSIWRGVDRTRFQAGDSNQRSMMAARDRGVILPALRRARVVSDRDQPRLSRTPFSTNPKPRMGGCRPRPLSSPLC